jgi:hypothetical protein
MLHDDFPNFSARFLETTSIRFGDEPLVFGCPFVEAALDIIVVDLRRSPASKISF